MVMITSELSSIVSPSTLQQVDQVLLHEWVLGRDGYHCCAPGCAQVENLEVRQVDPALPGGHLEPANLVTVCSVCFPLWNLMGRGLFMAEGHSAGAQSAVPSPLYQ